MSAHAVCHPAGFRPRRTRGRSPGPVHAVASRAATEAEQFRQLRHLTKNTLQRVMAIIACAPELNDSNGEAVGESLQQRIMTSARLSDALFGLTREPGNLRDRLLSLSDGLVDLLADDGASIRVSVVVRCSLSGELDDLVVRLAHELIGNAVKHGMHQRLAGTIDLDVREEGGRIVLAVVDDGQSCPLTAQTRGEGLSIVGLLLRRVDGTYELRREAGRTVATVELLGTVPRVTDLQPAS